VTETSRTVKPRRMLASADLSRRRTADHRAYAMLGIVMLFWAGNSIIGRAIRDDIPPFTLALVRWAGALCIIGPFAARHVRADRAVLQRHWKTVLLLGLVGVASFNALLYSGLRYTTATNGLLLQAAIPALVLVFDRSLFRTRPSLWQVVGVGLSTLGVVLIVFRGDPQAILSLSFGKGDLLVLGAVVAWSLYTSLLRLRPPMHPSSFLAATFAIGAVAMLPLAGLEWRGIAAIRWRPEIFGAFAYVAVLPSVVAYRLYNAAVAKIGAARAGQTTSLMPLFGALLAAPLLHESLHGYHVAGMMLILGGIATSVWMNGRTGGATDA
jgi:drug/metabolite transporter (DMT)-like permease